jgi:hypothetical protein
MEYRHTVITITLRECLGAHEDHVDLLYLIDREASLQAIHKWIGCGAKLNLSKSPDADILKDIILKLQMSGSRGSNSVNQGQGPQGGPLE